MNIRTSFGLSQKKNILQPQQQINSHFESRIDQPNSGYSNGQSRGPSNIMGQTNGNMYNNNPPMANNSLQQDQYEYKTQGKVGEFKTQAQAGEFEWLTHTYAINYYAYNGNANKIAEIVWPNLAAVKKIVIYTNQANISKINDQIQSKLYRNSVCKIVVINQSHSPSQLRQKYALFILNQYKILITSKGSAGSFQTGLIDVEDVQMIIFDGVCDAEDQYRQRVLRSSALQPSKRGVAITVCGRDQNKLLSPVQSRLKIKFIEFKPYDLAAYLKPKSKTTNNFTQQPELPKKQQVYTTDSRKIGIYDSQSDFMKSSPTKSATEQVADLSWITHFYFKPEYYMWRKVVSTLNENKDNYNKAVVYVSTENFKKLKVFINEDLANKSEVQYIDENVWETFGEAVNKFAASTYRILVITKTFPRMITITPIDADNVNFIIIDGILQAKDYKGLFTRTKIPKQEKAVSIIVLDYNRSRKQDLMPLERETGIKISQWSNQKLSDYLTIKRPQIRPQPEYQPQIINRIDLARIEEQKQIRRKKEQSQQLKRRKEEQQRRRKEQQQQRRRKEQQQQIKRRKEQQQRNRKALQQQQRRKAQQQQQRRRKAQQQQQRQRKAQQQQQQRRKQQQQQKRRKEQQQQQQRRRKEQQQQKQQQQRRRMVGERLRENERLSGIGSKGLIQETAGNNGRAAKTVDKLKDSRKIILLEEDRQKTFRADSRLSEQNNQQKPRINTKSEISEVSPIQKGMQPPVSTSSIVTQFDAEAPQISPTRKKDAPLPTYQAQKIQSKAIDELTNGLNRIESIAKDGSNTQAIILKKTMTLQSGQQQLIRDVNFLKQEYKRNSARIDQKKNEGAVSDNIYKQVIQFQKMVQQLKSKQQQITTLKQQQQQVSRQEMRQQNEYLKKLLETMLQKLSHQQQQIAFIKTQLKKQQISKQNRKQDKEEQDQGYIFNNDQEIITERSRKVKKQFMTQPN